MNSWGTVQHVSRMALMLTLGGAAALKLYAETATVAAYGLRNASVLASLLRASRWLLLGASSQGDL